MLRSLKRLSVKYKVLKSVCHNFSHSFVSFTNYVDEGYVIDDLKELARKANGERITIMWIPEQRQSADLTPRILKSISYWKAHLNRFVEASGSSLDAIQEFTTEIYLKSNKQIAVEGRLTDNRGRVYRSEVYDF